MWETEARCGQIILSGILPVFANRMIQKFEAGGDQRDDEEALQGRGRWICGYVGQLCGDRRHVREGRSVP